MNILIRTDSGNHIGTGHVMRTMTLAHALTKAGHTCTFLTRAHSGNIADYIQQSFNTIVMPGGVQGNFEDNGDYTRWLGVPVDQEIKDCLDAIQGQHYDLLIVDHYGLDTEFEKALAIKKVFIIDDLFNRHHHCHFLLHQPNSSSTTLQKYMSLNQCKSCKYFLGPAYALLRDDFLNLHPSKKQLEKVQNILIYFGGTDPTGECLKALSADNGKYQLHVILSKNHKDYHTIQNNPNVKLYPFVDNMAEFMNKMDVCFGAGGSTTWERICLAIPSFLTATVANQECLQDIFKQTQAIKEIPNSQWEKAYADCDNIKLLNEMINDCLKLACGTRKGQLIREITKLD